MKPFKWMFEEQNATEIEYKGKQVSTLYRYDKKGKYLNGCKEKTYEIHKYISLCGIKAGNVLDSILNYFSVHD